MTDKQKTDVSEDPLRFTVRECLRKTAATVHVVALRNEEGNFFATTATAVTVATLDPPCMIVCLNEDNIISKEFKKAALFSINILEQGQENVSNACAGGLPHEERIQVGQWSETDKGVPVLKDGVGSIVCSINQSSKAGTHHIIVGEAFDAEVNSQLNPLQFMDRGYGSFHPINGTAKE